MSHHTSLRAMRLELHTFFKSKIIKRIENEDHTPELLAIIEKMFINQFQNKYSYIVKQYDDSIRVSARYIPSGIVFFMAGTKFGKIPYNFKDPNCYIE